MQQFPLVLLQAKVVGALEVALSETLLVLFPLVLLQAKVVGICFKTPKTLLLPGFHQFSFKRRWWGSVSSLISVTPKSFPLVLLQAKVVGQMSNYYSRRVKVSISSPSSEGGGSVALLYQEQRVKFPLVLLQAKVVGYITYRAPNPWQLVSISSPSSEGGGSR